MSKIILAYVILTSAALIVLRSGASEGAPISFDGGKLQLNISLVTAIGVILFGLSFVLYTYLLSIYDLGYIVPITTALVYTIIFTASYFVFDEKFDAYKIMGIFLVLGGVYVLNLSSGS